ncbi:MAG TPA: hypothetical protein VEZ90_17435, partial [Blastocatellia bacterium]|nr:hypothetical protein [Blastocatellia bacterium]
SVLDANIDDAITRVDSSASSEGAPLGSDTEHTSKATHVTDPATRPWDEHTERDRHREDLEVGAGQTTPKETPRGLEPGPSIVRQTSWVLGTQGPPSAPEPAAAYQPHFEPTAKPEQKWDGWLSSPYNTKSLLGFQASVLRQLEFRSIAIPVCGWAHLVWYLKVWGKQIFSNDPRAWAAAASRTVIEPGLPLSEEQATDLIADAYVPAQRLTNPSLRDWFGESDACFMDNLREKIEQIENRHERDQALLLGIRTGDYAHAFGADSSDLRRPLTYVLRQFAAASYRSTGGHPYNRSSQMPSEEFIRAVRSDLLYLNLPAGHAELAGSYGRSRWRECWLTRNPASGDDEVSRLMTAAQSKQSYLAMVDRMLAAAGHLKVWAIECRNIGLASADEIAELVEAHRPVRATYSKDLTEVAGGLKNFAIVAQTR